MALVHFGQIGAAAANISGRDKARRILLVELPIHQLFFVVLCLTILPAGHPARGDKVPLLGSKKSRPKAAFSTACA
jgi:hypothetical protein